MVRRVKKRARVEAAFAELLRSLGVEVTGDLKKTPSRAADLWLSHLVAGEGQDPREALGRGQVSRLTTPVLVRDIGVHIVCPHHLTVAFGRAHVAYVPGGRLVGFGSLARLVEVCASRLALQEEVVDQIARTLVEHLGAHAAVAIIQAQHPCHNVLQGRSHDARAETVGYAGNEVRARALAQQLGGVAVSSRRRRRATR